MIGKIIKSIFSKFQIFLVIWGVLVVLNQLFLFHACFEQYCLIAALPHTFIIASLIVYFSNKEEDDFSEEINKSDYKNKIEILKVTVVKGKTIEKYWKDDMQKVVTNKGTYIDTLEKCDWSMYEGEILSNNEYYIKESKGHKWIQKR